MRKTLERDIQMVEMLKVMSKEQVAQKFGITMRGLDAWLTRLRRRRMDGRKYENQLLNLERRDARLKKILISAKYDEPEMDAEEWENY
jgi:hypothetical protein